MDIKIQETVPEQGKKVVGTYITRDMYDKLKAEADANFMSVSDLLRKLIYLHIKDAEDVKNS